MKKKTHGNAVNLFCKRFRISTLSLIMAVILSIPVIPATPVHATGVGIGIGVASAVSSGAMGASMISGANTVFGVVDTAVNFYNLITGKGKQGNINTYYYQGGDTYNTTVNYKVFNDYTKNTTVTTDYKYSFYNPVTNNYNYTNDYSYSPKYNTYYYTTHEGDKNTNYYVTDNTTNVSYYIIEENETTAEKFESYYEVYYELPDGRNSYNLSKEDIWGQYFIYNYSKYKSVAEDDGKTLGLWHLDGDLKDSSYWGNSAGVSYTSSYKDACFDGGKYLSTSSSDYLTLRLNKVTLPSSYTLEWVQYVPSKALSSTNVTDREDLVKEEILTSPVYSPSSTVGGVNIPEVSLTGQKDMHYNRFITRTNYTYTGASGFSTETICCKPRFNSLEHYAIVKNGNTYSYYINGVKTDCTSSTFLGGGIAISDNYIKFYVGSRTGNITSYARTRNDVPAGVVAGTKPTSSNFKDYNYTLYNYYNEYIRDKYTTYFNRDTIIDEVRLSKGAIYTKNFTPSTQPYITNTVLVTPDNPKESEIAFKTNYRLGDVRIGGARPVYPLTGDVFVNLTDDKVDGILQYQESGWYSISGAIYKDGKWIDLKGYDMSVYSIHEPTDPDNPDPDNPDPDNPDPDNPDPDNPDPDNPDPDNPDRDNPDPDNPDSDNPDDNKSIWDKIGDLLSGLFGIVESLISPLVDGIISLINMIMGALGSLTNLSEGFSNFLRATFIFIPDDILSIIGLGVMLTIFASIIKIFM